jgi:diacylglycerol kinase
MMAFIKRLRFAFAGWVYFFRNEANGQIQGIVAVLVTVAGFVLEVSKQEWLWLILCFAMVIALEMVNSAIEGLANRLHPDIHPAIKMVKDVAAGAVLWAAVMSAIIGLIIFGPKVLELFSWI